MYLLVVEVTAFMVLHVAFGAETLAAPLRADVRPLIAMDPSVDAKVLFLGK